MPDRSIEFESERQFHKLYGEDPENLLTAEKAFGVKIVARGNLLHIQGVARISTAAKSSFLCLNLPRGRVLFMESSIF